MVTTILASTIFFLALHLAVRRTLARRFDVDLKLSRGLAALLLVAIGFYSLFRWLPLWRQAFLVEHERGSALFYVLAFIAGHFLADFLWLAYGAWLGNEPRRDLILHHVLGLAVCAIAFYVEAGYAVIAVGMTTEMLPVATGLDGVGQARGDLRLRRAAARFGLAVLWLWRIPCWIFLFAVIAWNLRTGNVIETLRRVYPICFVAVLAVTAFDLYWTPAYLRMLDRFRKETA